MMPFLQNHSCDPFTPQTQPCQLGNYVSYSINVSSAEDVVAGIELAQANNIRLVIKNTGHEYFILPIRYILKWLIYSCSYLGKSTGAGSLGLWTHNRNSSTFIPKYQSSSYIGPAFRFGAGIVAYEAYYAADAQGLRAIGGECPTVGLAGGYTQGGGHSALSSAYGLGADQVLEWEVVTSTGQHLNATPTENSDLYWALSGGGGGTFGVVLSMTVRVFSDGPIGGASMSVPRANLSDDAFWAAISNFHSGLSAFTDVSSTAVYVISSDSFSITLVAPNASSTSDVENQIAYLTSYLASNNVSHTLNITIFDSYLSQYNSDFGPLPTGSVAASSPISSRLIPRAITDSPTGISNLTSVLQNILATPPFYAIGVALNTTAKDTIASNSVLPAWREALVHMNILAPWDYRGSSSALAALDKTLSTVLGPMLDAVAPESGTYVNEANFGLEGNWQKAFWRDNYARLKEVKNKYDPEDLMYVTKGVGSEVWNVDEGRGGRICRA